MGSTSSTRRSGPASARSGTRSSTRRTRAWRLPASASPRISRAQSTSGGVLGMTIPASVPSTYALSPGSVSDTIAPVSTCSLSGTGGANSWYTSSVSVSLSATDDRSGVGTIHFLIDGSAWQTYTGPVVVQGEGAHTVGYYATDIAGNNEATRSVGANIDTST